MFPLNVLLHVHTYSLFVHHIFKGLVKSLSYVLRHASCYVMNHVTLEPVLHYNIYILPLTIIYLEHKIKQKSSVPSTQHNSNRIVYFQIYYMFQLRSHLQVYTATVSETIETLFFHYVT
jgi:hypothetical protein